MPAWARQGEYGVRFQWGPVVAPTLSEGVCVVVDVLRFTTTVEAAVSRGVARYPYRWRDATGAAFADSVQAVLADGRDPAGPFAVTVEHGRARSRRVRGASVAQWLDVRGSGVAGRYPGGGRGACGTPRRWGPGRAGRAGRFTVIACGERWPDGSLRPSLEDLLGAGAILASVPGDPSPRGAGGGCRFPRCGGPPAWGPVGVRLWPRAQRAGPGVGRRLRGPAECQHHRARAHERGLSMMPGLPGQPVRARPATELVSHEVTSGHLGPSSQAGFGASCY